VTRLLRKPGARITLGVRRTEFSKMASSWFHEYLHARDREQLDLDYTFFTSGTFIESVGKGILHRFTTFYALNYPARSLHTHCKDEKVAA
jgi:hypothetical protein